MPAGIALQRGRDLGVVGPGQQDGDGPGSAEQLGHDVGHLLGRLAGTVDRLGHPLAQGPVVVDPSEPEVGEGQVTEPVHGVVRRDRADLDRIEQPAESDLVHGDSMLSRPRSRRMRVCFGRVTFRRDR
jgi:hypothetical protein